MLITERDFKVRKPQELTDLLPYLAREVDKQMEVHEKPIRFVVTGIAAESILYEVGTIQATDDGLTPTIPSIFQFEKRQYENTDSFNIALIIPTGIGCELGGHSGDGGAVARLFGSIADQLITHPNVVNASDINELPENGLYVEGSILSRLLMGTITLQRVRSNRVLLIVDRHTEDLFHELAVNAASAARVTLGLDCPGVSIMDESILMSAEFTISNRAAGRIYGFDRLCELLEKRRDEYDAVALSTLIAVPSSYHADYFLEDSPFRVNPWGGIEAMLTHSISSIYNVPSAHSPMMTSGEILNLDVGIVDPRKAAEAISMTFLHCVLKGLHRAPRVLEGIHSGEGLICNRDVSCLVIPDGCLGLPTLAAIENEIPVIAVRDRHMNLGAPFEELPFKSGKLLFADNYLEAAGIASSLKAGVALDTVKRPIGRTNVSTV